MRCLSALAALTAALLGLSSALAAQTVRLQVVVTVREGEDGARVSCRVLNRGANPALGLTAELWGSPAPPRHVVDELRRDGSAEVSWEIPREQWVRSLRHLAAVRVRYRDAGHAWASVVSAHGLRTAPAVDGPRWPDDPRVRLTWREPPARSGRVVWWSPSELAVDGPERWAAREGPLALTGTFRPVLDVTGWETSAFALLLPDAEGAPGLLVRLPFDARSFRSLWRPDARLLALYALLCVGAWAGAGVRRRRIRGKTVTAPRGLSGELFAGLPLLTAALYTGAVLLTIFPPRLLTLDTTPAGGDFASHIVALRHLREELLPSGRVYGWSHEQYAGFPLFVFYFPLSFLIVVLLSFAVPLTVALKLGALVGPLLLAPAWWMTLRWVGAPPAARWCVPGAALAFLLVEEQSVWGGNLASLLAGEFAYALGYPLAWLAMGYAWKTKDRTSGWWPVPALLALTGLAHGYTLLCAALGVLLLGVHPRLWWRRWWHIGRSGVLAFGLLAWWLLPLFWNLPWTNGFRERWELTGLHQLLPPAVWPACALVLVGFVRRVARRQPPLPGGLGWLLALAALLFAMYELGYSLGTVDIRFLPMLHGALLLAGCWELGLLIELAAARLRPALAAAAVAAASASAVVAVEYVPAWARWNLSGMERKARWPDYSGVMRRVADDPGAPRVAFEHHPGHDAAGTIRAFELLPYFARRATLEGLYFQSAPLAPPVFYLQSELSLQPSCPLPDYECGPFDPAVAVAHLRMLGAETLVAYSDSLKTALTSLPAYVRSGRSGVYDLFDLRGPIPLVEAARMVPVADRHPDWRQEAYDWFRAGTDLDALLVLGRSARERRLAVDRYRPGRLPRIPYSERPSVRYALGPQEVRIATDVPGHPLLVKVAYHPGWRASDGSRVELVAPGMMLVTPRSRELTLSWSAGWAGSAGTVLSVVTLLALVLAAAWPGVFSPKLPEARRAGWIGIVALVTLATVGAGVLVRRHPPLDQADLLAQGQRRLEARDFQAAEDSFARMLSGETRHGRRDDAAFYLGLVAAEAGEQDRAKERWRSFLEDFPVSRYRGETLVRMAELYRARGANVEALNALREAVTAPLSPPHWREAAREALRRSGEPLSPAPEGGESLPGAGRRPAR